MSTVNATPAGASFLLGILLGAALLAPVLPAVIAALPSLSSLGAVGKALVAGALAIVLLVFGVILLYLGFEILDD